MDKEEIQIWVCLECKIQMNKKDMELLNKIKECPYCSCTYFNVKIYEKKMKPNPKITAILILIYLALLQFGEIIFFYYRVMRN